MYVCMYGGEDFSIQCEICRYVCMCIGYGLINRIDAAKAMK